MVSGTITVRYIQLAKGMLRTFQLGRGKHWGGKLLNRQEIATTLNLKRLLLSNGLMQILLIVASVKSILQMYVST